MRRRRRCSGYAFSAGPLYLSLSLSLALSLSPRNRALALVLLVNLSLSLSLFYFLLLLLPPTLGSTNTIQHQQKQLCPPVSRHQKDSQDSRTNKAKDQAELQKARRATQSCTRTRARGGGEPLERYFATFYFLPFFYSSISRSIVESFFEDSSAVL